MYRELGSLDAFGVRGGPYTGTPRVFSWGALPDVVVARLIQCVDGKELPGPLLRVTLRSRARLARLAGALALIALALLVPMWLAPTWMPPMLLAFGYAAAFVPVARLLQKASVRDRLPPGIYLFPLDVVEASAESVRIAPFGSLKNAGIRREDGAIFLELTFDHGARYRFACADEAAAERAYDKIKQAHTTVERLTYQNDLEETVDLDPFFALRGEPAWADAIAAKPVALTLRDAIWASAGVLSGTLAFLTVLSVADQRSYQRAIGEGSEAAYQEYLAGGGRLYRETVANQLTWLQRDRAARDHEARDHEAEQVLDVIPDWRHQSDASMLPATAALRRKRQEETLSRYALAAAVAPKAPKSAWLRDVHFGGYLARIFQAARERGDDRMYFAFSREGVGEAQHELQASLDAREKRLLAAFSRVLSDTVPSNLLEVSRDDAILTQSPELAVHVHEKITARGGADFDVIFEVIPLAKGEPLAPPMAFSLRLLAPTKRLETLRPRSVFTVAEGGPRRAVDLMTARAFDRLYDELFGLFFPGDPRVPLADESAKAP